MTILLVTFTNKLNPSEITEKLQIDQSSDTSFLISLLNTLLSKNSNYFFYYKNERIIEKLENVIKKWNLSTEEVLNIDYVDEKDVTADEVINCDDVVISTSIFNNILYYITYYNKVYYFYNNKIIKLDKFINKKIIGVFRTKSNIHFYTLKEILNLNNEIIYSSKEDICCCTGFEDDIIIATRSTISISKDNSNSDRDNALTLDNSNNKDNKNDTSLVLDIKNKDIINSNIQSIKANKEIICWIDQYNTIAILSRTDNSYKKYKVDLCLNEIEIFENKIIGITSNNKFVSINLENRNISTFYNNFRFCNHILNVEGRIVVSTPNFILIYENDNNFVESSVIPIKGQINCINSNGSNLYVGNDTNISKFNLINI